jgi:hypothetical protein
MSEKITTIQRLSIIRNLYIIGLNQSYKAEPFSGFSILNFHDCIELFLQLSAEVILNKKTTDLNFMRYWELFSKKEINLPYKEGMRKLNKARVNLKHSGLLPSKFDIELFRTTSNEFLNESCLLLHKIKFQDISIIDYIGFEKTKEYLKLAEKEFKNENKKESANNLALSFFYLLDDYEKLVKSRLNFSPFSFNESVPHYNMMQVRELSSNIYGCIDSLSRAVDDVKSTLRIMSFGIDYIKYKKFDSMTPWVYLTFGKKHVIAERKVRELNLDNFEFCKNFIIETAFKFQENNLNED